MTNCRAALSRVVSMRRWLGRYEEGQGGVVVEADLGVEGLMFPGVPVGGVLVAALAWKFLRVYVGRVASLRSGVSVLGLPWRLLRWFRMTRGRVYSGGVRVRQSGVAFSRDHLQCLQRRCRRRDAWLLVGWLAVTLEAPL